MEGSPAFAETFSSTATEKVDIAVWGRVLRSLSCSSSLSSTHVGVTHLQEGKRKHTIGTTATATHSDMHSDMHSDAGQYIVHSEGEL